MELVERLLSEPLDATAIPDTASWKARRVTAGDPPVRALIGGLHADRPAWAFASGYAAATVRLLRDIEGGPEALGTCALCATEDKPPVHPARIVTEVKDGRVSGAKGFVTLSSAADTLLVLASAGRDGDRNRLALVAVDAKAPGVTHLPGPKMSFVPEIDHSAVLFDHAPGTVLPGDGWTDLVKPFRTIEDTHVFLGFVGWLVRVGRQSDLPEVVEQGLSLALSGLAIARMAPESPATHRALAGFLEQGRTFAFTLPWDRAAPEVKAFWERDQRLLNVASAARIARRDKAREARGART